MKIFRTLCLALGILFLCAPARAEDIPLFLPYPHIDDGRWYLSDGWVNGPHQSCEWRKDAVSVEDHAVILTLAKTDKGGAELRPIICPEMHTKARTGYGRYEVRMKTAAGSGLNSNFFTYVGPPTGSKQHDEIDFEFLGKDSRTVQLNWHTNGVGGHEKIIDLGFDAAAGFHDYAFDWQPLKITWYVDGKPVFETPSGADLPINPQRIYISLWSGTSPMEDSWLGPFAYTKPVSAAVEWVRFTPYGQEQR